MKLSYKHDNNTSRQIINVLLFSKFLNLIKTIFFIKKKNQDYGDKDEIIFEI